MAYSVTDYGRPQADSEDAGIVDERLRLLNEIATPRVGDFVRFADDTLRRISHIWETEDGEPEAVQTSDGGSFYLGRGCVSFSGSLYHSVPVDTLWQAGYHQGRVWVFHHDHHRAHNGVDFDVTFRVYACTMPAPR